MIRFMTKRQLNSALKRRGVSHSRIKDLVLKEDLKRELATNIIQKWWKMVSMGYHYLNKVVNENDVITMETPRGILFYIVTDTSVFRFEVESFLNYLRHSDLFKNPYTGIELERVEIMRLIRLYNNKILKRRTITADDLFDERNERRDANQRRETVNLLIQDYLMADNQNDQDVLFQQIIQLEPFYGSMSLIHILSHRNQQGTQ